MGSKKTSFTKNAQLCPVVGHTVNLSGILVEQAGSPGEVAVAGKSCSNVAKCLEKYERLENVPNCLIHSLRP
jgi:hypothetical protein